MNARENYLAMLEPVVVPEEIERLHKNLVRGEQHPLIALANAQRPHQVATNTEKSAHSILRKDQDWLKKLKPRLVSTSDTTSSSSALGEIRGYGALLETAMAVKTNPTVPGNKVSLNLRLTRVMVQSSWRFIAASLTPRRLKQLLSINGSIAPNTRLPWKRPGKQARKVWSLLLR
jgi:hypothetical protein